ncbi:Splicing factor U2AF-associated protein 2 [Hypsizygus marmoreus]|uniref:Splicing factor U2AF-associated protein 2 n=1 Tax=Hypsizygus marmoreus TaxID=39966 RepID=A0A369JD35_HYPMA|nr:Splicing factor U2AF-associated protein 2 [Hypsizygus marmoreus]
MSVAPPPSAAAGSSAEAQAAAFADDPRIYFSQAAESWRLEQDDGTELEYDASKGVWVPLVDEDLVKRQQAAYSVAGVDEETPAAPVLAREGKKRKAPEDYTSATPISEAGPSIKRGRNEKNEKPQAERKSKNTAVYVTGLPPDTEADELVERFSKCGVIEEDDSGEPKVKMYAKDDGTFSGEALVVYFKEDSVTLALNILDDAELRFGDPKTVMKVSKADFGHKASGGGAGAQEHKPRKTMDKKRASKRIGKMQKKLLEWDDEDGFGPMLKPEEDAKVVNQNSRVVVLKHMFTLKELEEDAALLLDLKEDVREECASLGEVTNVILYDKEDDGIMTVKFRDPISAKACLLKMNGRFFAGRRIEASLFSGKQRFKRTGAGEDVGGEGDEAEKKRLDDFAQWLLTEGD